LYILIKSFIGAFSQLLFSLWSFAWTNISALPWARCVATAVAAVLNGENVVAILYGYCRLWNRKNGKTMPVPRALGADC